MGTFLDKTGLTYLWSKIKSAFVTALGTSGNYLTWTKNGTTNNITVPYAEKSEGLLTSGTFSGDVDTLSNTNGLVKFHEYISGSATNLFPTTNNANAIIDINTYNGGAYNHQLGFSPSGMYYRKRSNGAFDNWEKLLTDAEGIPEVNISKGYLATTGYTAGSVSPTILPLVLTTAGNRLALLPPDQVIIEQTVDGGTTWTDAEISDSTKQTLFLGTDSNSNVKIPLINGVKNKLCGIRITITGMKYDVPEGTSEINKYQYWNSNYILSTERYVSLSGMYIWVSANSDRINTRIQCATGSAPNNWVDADNGSVAYMSGWSGGNYIFLRDRVFGGGTNQSGNYWNYRITCFTDGFNGGDLSTSSTTSTQIIHRIMGYGQNGWTLPNNLVKLNHLYTWDYSQNMITKGIYPTANNSYNLGTSSNKWANVYATTFNGNATSATTATTATNVSASSGTTNALRHVWFSDSSTETKRAYDDDFKYNPSTNTLNVANINGNATSATKATQDASGNTITSTYATKTEVNAKQDTLVSGTNIKTINNTSILGSGNIEIDVGGEFIAYPSFAIDSNGHLIMTDGAEGLFTIENDHLMYNF